MEDFVTYNDVIDIHSEIKSGRFFASIVSGFKPTRKYLAVKPREKLVYAGKLYGFKIFIRVEEKKEG